jgi:uncharacterized protein YeaO (DUF488 family)
MSYKGNDRLDITVRSGDLDFAPTWDMVMGVKNGTMDKKEYIDKYMKILRTTAKTRPHKWNDLLNKDEITLVCYCKKGKKFCHRYILAKVLDKMDNVEYVGER